MKDWLSHHSESSGLSSRVSVSKTASSLYLMKLESLKPSGIHHSYINVSFSQVDPRHRSGCLPLKNGSNFSWNLISATIWWQRYKRSAYFIFIFCCKSSGNSTGPFQTLFSPLPLDFIWLRGLFFPAHVNKAPCICSTFIEICTL